MHQNMPTVLWCHIAAFEVLGGTPREVLYDRRTTAVIGEGQPAASSTIASLSTWRATTVFTQGHANLRRDPNGIVALLRQACVIDHQNRVLNPDGPVGLNNQFCLKRTGIPMPSEMK